jgi:PAS domain S-box-containing protein
MSFLSNPSFLAIGFMQGSAGFLLLVLYVLLLRSFPGRFFRFWVAGWAVYTGLEALRTYSLVRGQDWPNALFALSLVAVALFFAAVWECAANGDSLRPFWPAIAILGAVILALGPVARMVHAEEWAKSLIVSSLYVASGWMLWRSHQRHRGAGWKLLAAALFLRGLHGLDRPEWSAQGMELFRVAFEDLFGIGMGIAMTVLVLEAGRSRTEDLSEKLRRLALITAEATQSSHVNEALQGILRHVVESLKGNRGVLLLWDDPSNPSALVLRASAGFNDWDRENCARIASREEWLKALPGNEQAFVTVAASRDPALRRWMNDQKLTVLVVLRVPGKSESLGLLGIGAPKRAFEGEEAVFLVNVANLLGLTVQNLALLESSATSRKQWLDTFDSIDDLIFVHSPDGYLLRANRAFAAALGIELPGLLGRPLREVLHPGNSPWSLCPYCEGSALRGEEADPTFGRYFLASDSAFRDSKNIRLGTIHVLKDLTTWRQAENKFRALFEKAQEGVFISTPEGHFLDFNDALMRMLGYENREDVFKADIGSEFYADSADRDRLKQLLEQYGEVRDFEFRFRRRDGEIRIGRESSFMTKDDLGSVIYEGFVLDVTEQKQAEMDIRRRNTELLTLNAISELLGQSSTLEDGLISGLQRMRELFSVDVGAVYLLDGTSNTLKQAAAVGYRSALGARKHDGMKITDSLFHQIVQSRATLLSGSVAGLPVELKELNRSERIAVSQVVVLWTKDRVIGILVVGRREARAFSTDELNLLAAVGSHVAAAIDKSLLLQETRGAYDSLRLAQEQLLQSEKMAAVGQLISGVAHELNNPLTAILGYTHLLKSQELVTARGADYVEKLDKQAQRTHHIVQNLLSFARRQKPERSQVQINQILEDTLILREYDMRLNNIAVHRDFDPHLPVTGGDFHQLQQVFLNILNNALDAIQEGAQPGEVWIRTTTAKDRIVVEFTDNGPGVQNPHRIFDPFYTTKPVGKGTGLGLSICYGIVKEHGGEIQVRNSPPRGATFAVTLPLLVGTAETPIEQCSRDSQNAGGKVLLVDIDEPILQLEQEILEATGASVVVARSAREAIDVLKGTCVDAVVSAANMPGNTSTMDLYRWIEQNRPDVSARVIFTTPLAAEGEETRVLRESGCPILTKPFQIEEFCRTVRSVAAPSAHTTLGD